MGLCRCRRLGMEGDEEQGDDQLYSTLSSEVEQLELR